jgi:hypothetical protein
VLVASLIVGTILAHFGIKIEALIKGDGFSPEHIEDLARQGVEWALPNLLLGAMVIVPVLSVPAARREQGLIRFRPPARRATH